MTAEPREQGGHRPTGAGLAGSTSQGGTSPLRWLLVIVPLLVIVAAGTNVLGLWTTSFQQAARDQRPRQPERRPPDKTVVGLRQPADGGAGTVPAAGEAAFDATAVVARLAAAKPADGAAVFRLCTACHAAEKNAPPRIGPNLWGIVGHRKAGQAGFNYSAALKAKGGTWSYKELAEYMHNPRTFAPGTSMAFVGISDPGRIADLLAYMRTLADKPAPLPK